MPVRCTCKKAQSTWPLTCCWLKGLVVLRVSGEAHTLEIAAAGIVVGTGSRPMNSPVNLHRSFSNARYIMWQCRGLRTSVKSDNFCNHLHTLATSYLSLRTLWL